jgi:hypothetical protein
MIGLSRSHVRATLNFAVMLSVMATLALGAHDKKGHTTDNREKERHHVVRFRQGVRRRGANSALVLPDHYHPVDHTRCWWAPTRRTNVRSASLEQVLCKVCLSLLWIVQILSLYEKRLSQGITKKMTAPGVSRRHARAHSSPPTRQGHLQRKRSPRGDAQGVVHTNPKVQAFTPAYGHG